MKKTTNKGITLIALVITIVIMLILATVTIGAINGGLFDYAGKAKREVDITGEKQVLSSAYLLTKGESKTGKIDKTSLQKNIDKEVGENNCDIYDMGDIFKIHFNNSDRWYVINNNGNIEEWVLEEETNGIYFATTKITSLELDGAVLLSAISTETPSTNINYNYLWSSSNPNVATVTYDGILKCGMELGTTTITCKGANNTEATCEVTTTAKIVYTNNGATNATANGNSASYANPIIPSGYSAINTKDATWKISGEQTDVDNGLVIMDNKGNQFVWIPVPNVIYDGTTQITSGTYTPMAELKNGSQTDYCGIIYSFTGTTASRLDQTASSCEPSSVLKADYIENDDEKGYALIKKYIKGMSGKSNSEIQTVWENQLQQDYNQCVSKTSQYGGFWISRYEISYDINNNRIASLAGAKSATTDEDNTKTWYGIYQKVKDYSDNRNYFSAMPWISQYSAMHNWMAKNGIPVGNNEIIEGASANNSLINGNIKYNDKVKNIFDLYWNRTELTQGVQKYFGQRLACGKRYGQGYALTVQSRTKPFDSAPWFSSRITLYVN